MQHNQIKIILIGAAAIAALGSLLPWVTATAAFGINIQANGMDGDGKLTLPLAIVVAVVALWQQRWTILPATPLAAIAAYEIVHITSKVSDANDETSMAHFSVGYGVWILAVGAAVAFAAACYAVTQKRSARPVAVEVAS